MRFNEVTEGGLGGANVMSETIKSLLGVSVRTEANECERRIARGHYTITFLILL